MNLLREAHHAQVFRLLVADLDGRLTAWFDEHGIEGVLIRPDSYVFGATEWPDEVPALIDDLHSHLTTTTPRITADVH